MYESDLDSSKNNYLEIKEKTFYENKSNWDMAIGLQEVDNLKPSNYLEKLLDKNTNGTISIEEVKKNLKNYYEEKNYNNTLNESEYECDFVSTRIVELLNQDNFELSVEYFKYIHKYLFQDVYDFAGNFRTINISKKEKILNDDTASYCEKDMIDNSLDYDISLEKDKNYKEDGIVNVINGITKFSTNIWQVHPFREGNTRATALFIQKYLISLGFNVDNSLFKEKSTYYRNSLVRSCYTNYELSITANNEYLKQFYENLILGKKNELHSENLIVKELF